MKKLPLLLSFALLGGAASAQTASSGGAIQGTVRDPSGAAVAGVRVMARQAETAAVRETKTDDEGRYYLSALRIGTYTLRFEKDGFTTLATAEFTVSVGQVVEQNPALALAGVTSSVQVNEKADLVETAATTASAALGGERIEEGPARSRNYMNFVMMAPGVAPSNTGAAQRSMTALRNPVADSGFSFSGLRGRNNSIEIDGVDNRDEATGGNRVQIGLEMIQEFRVAGAVTGAESGGAAGGLINVVTRTGVNLMHGDVTFFTQNEVFNARKPEAQVSGRPLFRRYQPGASWYGPLRRDRTFLAVAYEAERESAEEWSETPEEAVARINVVLARPGMAGIPVKQVSSGLFGTRQRGDEAFVKLNHQFSSMDSLAVRYAFSRGVAEGDVQGPLNFQDRSAGGSSDTRDHALAGNWFHVASPTVVLETRVQVSRRWQKLWPSTGGPMLEIPGVATFGRAFRLNAQREEEHYQGIQSVNWQWRRHRLSAGAGVHGAIFDSKIANRFGGVFIFPSLEAFEQDRPDVYFQAFGKAETSAVTVPVSAWIQDRWQVREGVLIEAGLRYDRQRMPAGLPSGGDQWSPRIGASWKPSRRQPLVLRAGFGLFTDRYPLLFLNEAMQKDGLRAFEQYAAGPAAATAYAAAKRAAIEAPLPGFAPVSYRASSAMPAATAQKTTFGAEYALDRDTTLTAQASWVRGLHLPRIRNAALGLPQQFELEQTAKSSYRGLSVALNRKLSRELAFLVSYDLGRTMDDGSDYDEQLMNPADARADWGRSKQYQKQRLAASALIDLPEPPSNAGPEWARELLGEWTVSPILTAGSGRAMNALLTTDYYRTGAYPISARPAGVVRNPELAPAIVSFDLRLMKTIPFAENRSRLQFGVESFNLLNRVNPVMVSEFAAGPAGRLESYRGMIESGSPRQLQFFMQFEY